MDPVWMVSVTVRLAGRGRIAALSINRYINVCRVVLNMEPMIWKRPLVFVTATGPEPIAHKVCKSFIHYKNIKKKSLNLIKIKRKNMLIKKYVLCYMFYSCLQFGLRTKWDMRVRTLSLFNRMDRKSVWSANLWHTVCGAWTMQKWHMCLFTGMEWKALHVT